MESLCHSETEQLQAERLSADDFLFHNRSCLATVPRPFNSCDISGDGNGIITNNGMCMLASSSLFSSSNAAFTCRLYRVFYS